MLKAISAIASAHGIHTAVERQASEACKTPLGLWPTRLVLLKHSRKNRTGLGRLIYDVESGWGVPAKALPSLLWQFQATGRGSLTVPHYLLTSRCERDVILQRVLRPHVI